MISTWTNSSSEVVTAVPFGISQTGGARRRRTGSVKVRASDSHDHVRATVIEGTARERRRRRRDRRSVSPARPHLRRASRRGAARRVSPRPFVPARSGRDCHIQFESPTSTGINDDVTGDMSRAQSSRSRRQRGVRTSTRGHSTRYRFVDPARESHARVTRGNGTPRHLTTAGGTRVTAG